ncbi:GntR family transcriptional regulator [Frondihabitans australicus]|uniref:GntR family transcriptional regulator n=1 Tax=Frondihabitans australicus TaxID=386892 RepID=A0A495ID79_9MICO|nr:GntR family transcriptional regulator [Frondihabitans australicus]RKR72956.1 GntR family transcriptional regulator [Frondihabitans australicus]
MPIPDGEKVELPQRRLLTDDVFDRLRDDIVRGYLAGGQRIHDLELAQSLGLSRATVRTAILRLAHVGLVEAVPNLYTRVTEIDLRRYLEAQDTARALYVFAARYGTPLITEDLLERMRDWSEHLGDRDTIDPEPVFTGRAEIGFFQVFVDSTKNAPLDKTLQRLRPTLQRVLGQFAHLMPAREMDAGMLDVVEAVLRCDADAAATRLAAFYDGPLELFHDRLRAVA